MKSHLWVCWRDLRRFLSQRVRVVWVLVVALAGVLVAVVDQAGGRPGGVPAAVDHRQVRALPRGGRLHRAPLALHRASSTRAHLKRRESFLNGRLLRQNVLLRLFCKKKMLKWFIKRVLNTNFRRSGGENKTWKKKKGEENQTVEKIKPSIISPNFSKRRAATVAGVIAGNVGIMSIRGNL